MAQQNQPLHVTSTAYQFTVNTTGVNAGSIKVLPNAEWRADPNVYEELRECVSYPVSLDAILGRNPDVEMVGVVIQFHRYHFETVYSASTNTTLRIHVPIPESTVILFGLRVPGPGPGPMWVHLDGWRSFSLGTADTKAAVQWFPILEEGAIETALELAIATKKLMHL